MIQIDMPMPKNCLECPACNEYLTCTIPINGRKWGENDVREFGQGRPEWCPMKEQANKKLIDADKLREKLGFAERCEDCKHDSWKCGRDTIYSLYDFCVEIDIAIDELMQEGR